MINLHVTTKDSKLSVAEDIIFVENEGGKYEYNLRQVQNLYIYQGIFLTSDLIRKCHENGVELIFCRESGFMICSTYGPMYGSRSNLCFRQLSMVGNPLSQTMASTWILDKYRWRHKFLMTMADEGDSKVINKFCKSLGQWLEAANDPNKIFTHEARWDKAYYVVLNNLISNNYRFKRAERRSGRILGNAVLNYLYGMLYITL